MRLISFLLPRDGAGLTPWQNLHMSGAPGLWGPQSVCASLPCLNTTWHIMYYCHLSLYYV